MEFDLSQRDYEIMGEKKPSAFMNTRLMRRLYGFSQKYGGTNFIIGICVATYLLLGLFLRSGNMGDIVQWGGNIAPSPNIEVFRFINAVFLHANFIHLLLNMVSVYFLGSFLDKLWNNPHKTFFIFFVSAVMANALSFFIRGALKQTTIISVGASGGVFALVGSMFAYILFSKTLSSTVKTYYLKQLSLLCLINLLMGLMVPNIDLLGHVSGLIVGLILTFLIEWLSSFMKSRPRGWFITWLISIVIILSSFIYATVAYWKMVMRVG